MLATCDLRLCLHTHREIVKEPDVSADRTPSILFGISDTGGGHRAGAVAIDAALEQLAALVRSAILSIFSPAPASRWFAMRRICTISSRPAGCRCMI